MTLRGGAVWYAKVAEDSRADELLPVRVPLLTEGGHPLDGAPLKEGGCLLAVALNKGTKTAASILERILSADSPPHSKNKEGVSSVGPAPHPLSSSPYPLSPTDCLGRQAGGRWSGGCGFARTCLGVP